MLPRDRWQSTVQHLSAWCCTVTSIESCPSEVQRILCALKNGMMKNTEREDEYGKGENSSLELK
jgi:hypothetical protein